MQTVNYTLGKHITLEEIFAVANGSRVEFDAEVLHMLDQRRKQIVNYIHTTEEPAYGFNRGFGGNVDKAVDPDRLIELQQNLIRSHSCGTGDPAPIKIVRAAMFLRAISLAKGHSGIRSVLVSTIVDMLNNQISAVVPRYGSVGASGDLAPLSHMALAMTGEGEVFVGIGKDRERMSAKAALQQFNIEPVLLEMKEGLALNNGLQYSTAFGIVSYFKLLSLLKTGAIITASSTQVMLGSDTPFLQELHSLRPHNGSMKVAKWIWDLLQDSPIIAAHRTYNIDGEIQDPYNIRCAAQILGTCYDLLDEAKATFEIEANSVTDNPLILPDLEDPEQYTRIISGGHFHGMPVAVKLYNLMQAMGIMSRLSNMRCARFVDNMRNKGLPRDLKWPLMCEEDDATCSGMMIPEYANASLTNYIWGACMPSHLFSLSTDGGQEDHVSMSAGLAVRVWETIPRLAEALAIELSLSSQAAAIRKEMDFIPTKIKLNNSQRGITGEARRAYKDAIHKVMGGGKFDVQLDVKLKYNWSCDQRELNEVCTKVIQKTQEIFPTVMEDRYMAEQIQKLSKSVLDGEFVKIAEGIVKLK